MSFQNPELQSPIPPDPNAAIQPGAEDFVETPDSAPDPAPGEPLPFWIYLACGFALFMAGSSFTGFSNFGLGLYDQGMGGPSLSAAGPAVVAPLTPMALGQKVYSGNCASCHQGNGEGQAGKYPPLAGSEWVIGDKNRLGAIILHGLTGPVTVKGASYGSDVMAAWEGTLNNEQIANVMTYIRGTWGNTADAVTTDDITAAKAATSTMTSSCDEAGLLKIAPHNDKKP